MSNLDDLFAYPQDDQFYIINDWNTKGNHVGQGTCYSFVVGTLGEIKEYFESNAEAVIEQYGTATQQKSSAKIIEKYGQLNFWPEDWFQSFKYHCLPHPLLRHLKPRPSPNQAPNCWPSMATQIWRMRSSGGGRHRMRKNQPRALKNSTKRAGQPLGFRIIGINVAHLK